MIFQLQLGMEDLHLYTLRIDTSQTTLHSNETNMKSKRQKLSSRASFVAHTRVMEP